jgi:acyl carrier protein
MNKKNQILEIIADILEVELDDISFESSLDKYDWDSLAVVTFISEIDSEFDQILPPSSVNEVKTVADLIGLVE